MEISLVDSLSRKMSVSAIAGYQRYISPHKGFICAHRVLYGGESCSQYIKRVIAQEGLNVAFRKSRARFKACKQANLILRSQAEELEPPEETQENQDIENKKKNKPTAQYACSENSSATNCAGDAIQASCDCADVANIISDCSQADCIGFDCSGLDCGFLDCGGCGI
jgi:putative component of membrane protein insertase Oxa1/YidC/SpoIIIJ protein YidD